MRRTSSRGYICIHTLVRVRKFGKNTTKTIAIIIKRRITIIKDDDTCDNNNYRKVGGKFFYGFLFFSFLSEMM